MSELLFFIVDPPTEPPHHAAVLDRDEDVWQRHEGGWSCAVHGEDLEEVEWLALGVQHGPLRIIYTPA